MANRAEPEETICPAHRSRAPEPGPLARKNAPAANQHAITQTGARPPKAPLPRRGKQRRPALPQRPLPCRARQRRPTLPSIWPFIPHRQTVPPTCRQNPCAALSHLPRAPRKASSAPPWANQQIRPPAANSNAARSFPSPARKTKRRHNHASAPASRGRKHNPFLDYFPTRTSSNSLQISSEGGAVSSDTTTMHSAENTNAGNSS